MIRVIQQRKIWFIFSSVLVGASIVVVAIFGLKPGIDFTGGALTELGFEAGRPSLEEMQSAMEDLGFEGFTVQPAGEDDYIIRTKPLTEEERLSLVQGIRGQFEGEIREDRFESIGPTIGKELREKSVYAIITVLVAIVLYVAFAFRKVSGQLSSWKLGVTAIAALVHDVVVTLGVFALLGYFLNVEVDTLFVTALLMVLGYSVNDTIVVFDKIRQNIVAASTSNFERVVETSVNQTVVRSLNTSVTTLFVLLALFFLGGESLKWFVMALIVGVVVGTYSSIFLASPLLVAWQRMTHRNRGSNS
ncbi:MAG: protein translocase subunit SecF [Candidatus Doudnabacteria bacterium]|nr:protein translocase subunit SecF [Candidatus Doudnabacteria bacterium]MCA9387701.1 protein translocase subunit SecF [Candidatus Andersenbacteria bacterium]